MQAWAPSFWLCNEPVTCEHDPCDDDATGAPRSRPTSTGASRTTGLIRRDDLLTAFGYAPRSGNPPRHLGASGEREDLAFTRAWCDGEDHSHRISL